MLNSCLQIWISDSDNSDEFEGDWDDDKAELSSSPALRNPDAPGPSTLVWQVIGTLLEMGSFQHSCLRATNG